MPGNDSTPYGGPGCRCWGEPDDEAPGGARWMPNAGCRHHGLLAGYTRPRTDTGTYRVVDLPLPPEPTGCSCSVNEWEPCPYCAQVLGEVLTSPDRPRRQLPPGPTPEQAAEALAFAHTPTAQKESGVLATVRRWVRGRRP